MRSQKWYKGLAITMVVGGIGGEGLFEYLAARAEDRVRRFDEKLTEVAQASALDALKNARDAQEQTKREIDARLVLEKQLIAQGPRWRMLEARKGPFIEVLRKYKYQPVTIMECGAWGSITPERFRIEQDLVNFLGTTVFDGSKIVGAGWKVGYIGWNGCPPSGPTLLVESWCTPAVWRLRMSLQRRQRWSVNLSYQSADSLLFYRYRPLFRL